MFQLLVWRAGSRRSFGGSMNPELSGEFSVCVITGKERALGCGHLLLSSLNQRMKEKMIRVRKMLPLQYCKGDLGFRANSDKHLKSFH